MATITITSSVPLPAACSRWSPYDLPAPVFYVWYAAHTIRHTKSMTRVIAK